MNIRTTGRLSFVILAPKIAISPSISADASSSDRRHRRKLCVMARKQANARETASRVEPTRVHCLNSHKVRAELDRKGKGSSLTDPFVLYWMQSSIRSRHSPALEYAAEIASNLEIPLKTVHLFDVVAQDNKSLPERHAYFQLEALSDTQKILRDSRNITLAVVAPGSSPEEAIPKLADKAVAVVTDTSYLRRGIRDRARVAEKLESHGIPMIAIEGDIVVPVEEVSDHAEHAARTIRPKISKLTDDYLNPLEPVQLSADVQPELDCRSKAANGTRAWLERAGLETLDVRDIPSAVAQLPGLDHGAPRVPQELFCGGETQAQRILKEFLEKKLARYAEGRNEPALGLQSDLSPYLRTGAISPVDVVIQTKEYGKKHKSKGVKDGTEGFLEELVVRRELGVNMCWFEPDGYDVYERTVPQFARITLNDHRSDQRSKIYSYEELEAAQTSDDYWNAAQLELLVTGKVSHLLQLEYSAPAISAQDVITLSGFVGLFATRKCVCSDMCVPCGYCAYRCGFVKRRCMGTCECIGQRRSLAGLPTLKRHWTIACVSTIAGN